jgi:hypothetical protein
MLYFGFITGNVIFYGDPLILDINYIWTFSYCCNCSRTIMQQKVLGL